MSKILGCVLKRGSEIVWSTDGWQSDKESEAAAFLNAAGIGTELNTVRPNAYQEELERASDLVHGDRVVCFVEKSPSIPDQVY